MASDNNIEEREWLDALAVGQEWALRRIFDRYYGDMLAVAFRLIPDVDTCKDVSQEVLVNLWNKREQLDIHTDLRAYLRRAVTNQALNHLKSRARWAFSDESDLLQVADTADTEGREEAERDLLEASLTRAIDNLPEKCRLVFHMSRFGRMSHREIAEKLNISTKTVENQITKAFKLLREYLSGSKYLSWIGIFSAFWGGGS